MDIDLLWVLLCSGLVFLMQAGFMCLESGLTRSKNSINVAVKNLADFILSAALFWGFGYALMFGVTQGGWLGSSDFFFAQMGAPALVVFFLFQTMFCGTATTIISGAVAERLKFSAYLAIVALVSGAIYPIFGHWVWNGLADGASTGWLAQLGFTDFAGSTVVHSVGAWTGLAALVIVGPRQGRFADDGTVKPIQGWNMPFSVLGVLLLWFGWIGFNGGSTLAFDDTVPGIVLNTMLAGMAGAIAGSILSWLRGGLLETDGLVNGAIAGLVAITASCHVVSPPLAIIIGATGAAAATLVSYLLLRWRIDDAVDAVAVHGGAGAWGTLCVALFGNLALLETGLDRISQVGIQFLGILVGFVWTFGASWLALQGVNRVLPLRVSPEEEELGLNVSEHRAKTETYELFEVMDAQARGQDLNLRVPVEPHTEIGHIATRYNQVMDALERNHETNIEVLEKLYELAAVASGLIDRESFDGVTLDLAAIANRDDDLGVLARSLDFLVATVQRQEQQLKGDRDTAES